MKATPITACANCQRLQVQLDALQARVDALQAQLATARKDSSTSSKPPSSDIVRPPKPHPPSDQPKRQPGGQPGHPKYERSLLPPEQLQASHDYYLELCPTCGLDLVPSGAEPRRIQQIEIATVPLHVHEHRTHPAWCPRCQKIHYAPLPAVVQHGGLAGPRLTTLIAFLKGGCHASFSTIRTFLRDVVQVSISRGQLAKIIDRVSQALEQPYEQLLQALPDQPLLNVDETGHKDNGERMWTWCFRASLYTVFKIDPTRSADVLIEVLGTEFQGVLGCDYFSAYRRYMREFNVVLQFCLAHFIRDVKFLATLPDARDRDYGEKLCGALRDLFAVIHCREKGCRSRGGCAVLNSMTWARTSTSANGIALAFQFTVLPLSSPPRAD